MFKIAALAATTLLLWPVAAHPQTPPAAPPQPAAVTTPPRPDPPAGGRFGTNWADFAVTDSVVPLKVQLVISRYQGEKKISSLPYMLSVNANDKAVASLRMGTSVPVRQNASQVYRDVGTNIDCQARAIDDGRFRLSLSIEDSSVYTSDGAPSASVTPDALPAIRSFKLSNTVVLRDGQSTQFTTATDKISGEVTRIDLTLTVVK